MTTKRQKANTLEKMLDDPKLTRTEYSAIYDARSKLLKSAGRARRGSKR